MGQKLTLVISLSLCPIQRNSINIIAINIYCTLVVCKAQGWGIAKMKKAGVQSPGTEQSSARRWAPPCKAIKHVNRAKGWWDARGRWKGLVGRTCGGRNISHLSGITGNAMRWRVSSFLGLLSGTTFCGAGRTRWLMEQTASIWRVITVGQCSAKCFKCAISCHP